MQADIRKVNYTVEERGLFIIGFTSGVSNQIETIDAFIEENATFSIVPDHSKIHFVGRIKKEKDLEDAAAYVFIVDELVAPK